MINHLGMLKICPNTRHIPPPWYTAHSFVKYRQNLSINAYILQRRKPYSYRIWSHMGSTYIYTDCASTSHKLHRFPVISIVTTRTWHIHVNVVIIKFCKNKFRSAHMVTSIYIFIPYVNVSRMCILPNSMHINTCNKWLFMFYWAELPCMWCTDIGTSTCL